jgi:ribonuclease Z
MDMEAIIFGTGNAMVTKCFNTCFALRNGKEYFGVDAGGGNGILVQYEKANIDFKKMHHMFFTHGHTDHVIGAVWIVRKIATLMSTNKFDGRFDIYCHDEVANIIRTFTKMTLTKKLFSYVDNGIFINEVKDGDTIEACGMKISFFDIASTKAKQFGFAAVLPDGQKFVCLGDEPYNPRCEKYATGADWLLSEAFCLYDDREIFKPYEKHHSTALDAGKLASQLGVKNLVLYHTEDKNLAVRKERYTKEAASVFDGKIYVPDDLERIKIG